MKSFLQKIYTSAKKHPKRIVFPEGEDERVLKAIEIIQKENFAYPILLGDIKTIQKKAKKLKINWDKIEIHNPKTSSLKEKYTKRLFKLREKKGLTLNEAKKKIKDKNYFGTMMVENNYADGMITGSSSTTAEAIRPALEIIKTHEKFHKVSGIFFMILDKQLLLFADTSIIINPSVSDLVDITIDSSKTAKKFGIKPRIALLSFSTKGSAITAETKKIQEALKKIKKKDPSLIIDGEMQVDAALVKEVAKKKCPNSVIQGNANVLIFPNLEAANIAYKLVERLAGAKAIGPFLQGLKKPINDLSRGCSYEDIVNVTAFTVCECE